MIRGNRFARHAVEAIASGDEVALELDAFPVERVAQLGRVRAHVVRAHVLDLEVQPLPRREARGDEILHHFLLTVHRDRASAGEVLEVDAMVAALEAQRDAAMHESFAIHAFADSGLAHEIHGPLLEHARAHSLLDVLATATFEHHGVDADSGEQVREHEPRGPRSDDADLCPFLRHATSRA